MKPQEKKYRVDSFDAVLQMLQDKLAVKKQTIVSTHYYGKHAGSDVEKFVEYSDHVEIHALKEEDGRFTMTEHRVIADRNEGIAWLKQKGYTNADIVTMEYTEYDYKNGTVGLYTIDDFLKSVILYYPPNELPAIEKEFGLQNVEVITIPYNKYLETLDRLRSMPL